MKVLTLLLIICLSILGIYVFRKVKSRNIILDITFGLSSFVVITLFCGYTWSVLPTLMSDTWSQARLVPTLSILHGYKQINALDVGPVQTWMYGPLAALAYMPIGLLESPKATITLGFLLNIAYFFTPIFLCLIIKTHRKVNSALKLICVLMSSLSFYFVAVINSPSLLYSAFRIGPDSTSLCLASISILLIYKELLNGKKIRVHYLGLSALCLILAIWTKQNVLPLLLLCPIYLAITSSPLYSVYYVIALSASVILVSTPLVLIFGWDFLRFSMVDFPSNHPSWMQESTTFSDSILSGNLNGVLIEEIFGLFLHSIPYIFAFLFLFVLANRAKPLKINSLRKLKFTLTNYPEFLFVFSGIFMAPVAILSKIKWGGDINSFSVCIYFLSIPPVIMLASILADISFADSKLNSALGIQRVRYLFASVTLCSLIVITVIFNPVGLYRQGAASWYMNFVNPSDIEVAFATMKTSGHKVYFPDFQLANLLVRGELFHSMKGIYDRKIGRSELSHDHFAKYIPENFEFVAFGSEKLISKSKFQQDRIQEFVRVMEENDILLEKTSAENDLIDWVVYQRLATAQ